VTVEALFGLGGVGKTQLAIEYAHRYAADHWLVCWIDAEHPALIGAQLAALVSELGLPAAGPVIDATDAVLAELRARSGWLLVLDNAQRAEDVVAVLPTAGMGHVLVTSRHRGWGGIGGRTEVDVLTRAETTRLLRRRLPELDEDLADSLAEELGDLPLAAAQAAGYLEATAIPPATYLRRFRTRRHTLLDRGHVIGYHGTLDTAWTLSLDRLRQEAPAAVRLLHVAAFLAPEPIPLRWFTGHQQALQGPLGGATADPYDLDEVVGSIVGYSLGRRVGDQLQIHRLVQAAIRHRLPDTVRRQVENHAWAILIDASRVEPLSPRNRNHRAPTTTREGCRRGHIRPSQPPPGVSTAGAKSGRHNPRVTPPSGARSDRPGGARSR
jgi:hypothetical protein